MVDFELNTTGLIVIDRYSRSFVPFRYFIDQQVNLCIIIDTKEDYEVVMKVGIPPRSEYHLYNCRSLEKTREQYNIIDQYITNIKNSQQYIDYLDRISHPK